MEISKLKLEIYDLAAVILPGMLLMAESAVLFIGWLRTLIYVREIHGTELLLILLCSFAFGNLVQEAGDRLIKHLVDKRFFKRARDRFWNSAMKKDVCAKIARLGGPVDPTVDVAFDFCLTCIEGSFVKRDVFLAISDLGRSLFLLSILLALPLTRTVVFAYGTAHRCAIGLEGSALIAICASLSWSRMVRFRELAEAPVFHSFLAPTRKSKDARANDAEDD